MWKHLERLGGGIGTRGPGETQLETDRRLARTPHLADQPRACARTRATARTMRKGRSRSAMPSVSLAGYTNVGKSTLLNALTGPQVSIANRLFETLDPTTRAFDHLRPHVPADRHGRLHPQAAARARRGVRLDARGDAPRRPAAARRRRLGAGGRAGGPDAGGRGGARRDRGADDLPRLLVLNKIDRCDEVGAPAPAQPPPRRRARLGAARARASTRSRPRSPSTSRAATSTSSCSSRTTEGALLAELYALGSPIEREDEADGVRVRAHLPLGLAERYARFRVPYPREAGGRGERGGSCASRRCATVPPCRPRLCTTMPASTSSPPRLRRSTPGDGRRWDAASPSSSRRAVRAGRARARAWRRATASRSLNGPGLIDAGYRGEIRVMLHNTDAERRSRSSPACASPSW